MICCHDFAAAPIFSGLPYEPWLRSYTNLSMHMYYMGINGAMKEREWQLLRDRGLITDLECAALKRVEKKPAHVCMWALRLLYRLQHKGKLSEFQANELKMHITGVRGFAAKQIAYHNTPLPKPFFDFVQWGVHLYLMVLEWNGAVRWVENFRGPALNVTLAPLVIEPFGMITIIAVYNSLRKVATMMTNAFGDDEIDYDLDFDLRKLWSESLDVVKAMKQSAAQEHAESIDMPDLADEMIDASVALGSDV
mmetsp:Transcript_44770/g.89413  ORF Transcript_44770/g.89413 Transcript_44770/m.89413 type:complete len:251 (-) Transcript_44770:56-808(-)